MVEHMPVIIAILNFYLLVKHSHSGILGIGNGSYLQSWCFSRQVEVVAFMHSAFEQVILKQYENVSAIQSHAGMKETLGSVNKSWIRLYLNQC